MFDFFLALFGGLYYAGKSSYHKSQDKLVENRNRKYEITEMTIRRDRAFPKTLADGWVMLSEIESELTELFGNDWVELFKRTDGGFRHRVQICENPKREAGRIFQGHWDIWVIACNVWLSKQGYISDVEYQIVSPGYFGEIWLTPEESYKYPHLVGKANGHRVLLKMFQTMEKNIKNHYPDQNFGLWLYYSELATQTSTAGTPWTIKWSYWFERIGYTPQQKPW